MSEDRRIMRWDDTALSDSVEEVLIEVRLGQLVAELRRIAAALERVDARLASRVAGEDRAADEGESPLEGFRGDAYEALERAWRDIPALRDQALAGIDLLRSILGEPG